MGRDETIETEKVVEMSPEIASDAQESADLVLFQVKECYVYMIPPRKSAASYRADEWNINKWDWEGVLRVVSKGEECSIRLEDKTTGELYAQAFVREDYPLPVEAVIDSSRFFVLRIEDTSTNSHGRHAFIGLGFRERPEAYDFQAALFDHVKYLNKKKEAQEMEQEYQSRPSMDYSLKEGETLTLQLKTPKRSSGGLDKFGRVMDVSALQEALPETQKPASLLRAASGGHGVPILAPPPPPPLSPVLGSSTPPKPSTGSPGVSGAVGLSQSSEFQLEPPDKKDEPQKHDAPEEDFGDFQVA
ncbi:unnamed protein product [Calypogeia fissa]